MSESNNNPMDTAGTATSSTNAASDMAEKVSAVTDAKDTNEAAAAEEEAAVTEEDLAKVCTTNALHQLLVFLFFLHFSLCL